MRGHFILFIAIIFMSTQGAAGFTVSWFAVVPPGDLEDRTMVTITCEIPRTGILLYDQLVIVTDLDSPVWEPVVIVHDRETPVTPASQDGNRLVLNGAAFNYPEPVPAKLRLIVKGWVPANHTANQTLLDIRQIDSGGIPYAWPSGNFTLPMPGLPTGTVPVLPATTIPIPEETLTPYTMPAIQLPSPAESLPAAAGTNPEKTRVLPTPLPDTRPKKTASAGPLVVLAAVGIAALFTGKCSGRYAESGKTV
ncbi:MULTISPECIES: hypothetical protein [unclassified Methanoregula]|uniref:hypothetical protein n=1 Tax=unclassified Methanoregula TaxID=2649730 RepID=UPI0009CB63AB|nr:MULTISPECIES: hypothetical protein [unclassified Methanoregula]OPX63108.1 MAG: hypothetical protein A4E33_01791 [Methanoregula sp. PtaB.Bin085]OPY36335.1 MAG: hypothetical protein A4E34_00300 [Methanoregula sp. PtaU1.Bin006]